MYSPVKLWRNQKNVQALLGKTGVIVSWTVVRVPPEGFSNQAPYPVVVVDLEDKKRMSVQMVDWEPKHCRIGQRVRVILRRISETSSEGIIPYGVKVKPI
ncbi:MAG: hypothetical protein UW37_C0007G0022 [Candidatus Gottesmanbacteria bacterium GW2011_GWA2_44_17]|uniref:ChsH2 C-terminal OB-fold domain-containing protein n=3 Tax=Candidatus Gottesmaniibacteriota TaxID=1752720 RepID=A0A0G1LMY7_9BACT|nr:MAG: hypothetical protein UV63_C0019G0017 [Microgenomates group bacterium GW2011_GWC1_43_11]KKT38887.1 MAG: hypothetical protein UW22_C0004G0017 [Candidatus Gottesmanbacteria bacterium GW2011_GWB1_44_11c]KKT47456.1 MAG: hypothetical protein UW37_C0007G0022 [Candidatus Gottesmanbacteria bacterium GW2011_GWA2_44_17]KKT61249.1 MAG: hypothetical protein UW52_C0007G0016 [Candidatus Gottesmanbacteria bacterium GW2011_GWA1_44_24b]HCM82469.1 hypothetical protein [Patescibacteria group bacterium]